MNAETFNARYPVGTPVFAYPGVRPPHRDAERLVTRTRSRASVLGGHTDVVWVEGHGACIALTHVDVVSKAVFEAAAVVEGALPMPVGISGFLAALSGGDLPADAVREERCLREPIGCGLPLITADGTARVFWDAAEAARYQAEWQITGLCPDCQDTLTDVDEEAGS